MCFMATQQHLSPGAEVLLLQEQILQPWTWRSRANEVVTYAMYIIYGIENIEHGININIYDIYVLDIYIDIHITAVTGIIMTIIYN